MLNIAFKFILINSMLVMNSFAYGPTLESLLSNGSNVEIGTNSVVANLIVKEKSDESPLIIKSEELKMKEHALKLLIYNENEEKPRLTRVYYKSGLMSKETLLKYSETDFINFANETTLNDNVDAAIFYGVMGYLLNNNSSMLLNALKKESMDLKSNRELFDNEKMSLLSSYKEYLVKTKDEDLDIENPLKPSDAQAQEKVNEIMKRPFLTKDQNLKRIKEGKEFFYIVDNENIYIKFDSLHQLRQIKVKRAAGEIEVILGKYGVWESQLKFPEFILLKNSEQKWFEIRARKISVFSDNSDLYKKRLQRYSEAVKENNLVDDIQRPIFIL